MYKNNVTVLKKYPCVGDQIKAKNGMIGYVKYVGQVHGMKKKKKFIGVELKKWNLN